MANLRPVDQECVSQYSVLGKCPSKDNGALGSELPSLAAQQNTTQLTQKI